MWNTIRLIMLRRKVRRIVIGIYAAFDKENSGNRLTIEMKPHIWEMARKADDLLDKIEKLDPNAPHQRVTPMLREIT